MRQWRIEERLPPIGQLALEEEGQFLEASWVDVCVTEANAAEGRFSVVSNGK